MFLLLSEEHTKSRPEVVLKACVATDRLCVFSKNGFLYVSIFIDFLESLESLEYTLESPVLITLQPFSV